MLESWEKLNPVITGGSQDAASKLNIRQLPSRADFGDMQSDDGKFWQFAQASRPNTSQNGRFWEVHGMMVRDQ